RGGCAPRVAFRSRFSGYVDVQLGAVRSFPTRRSSDLADVGGGGAGGLLERAGDGGGAGAAAVVEGGVALEVEAVGDVEVGAAVQLGGARVCIRLASSGGVPYAARGKVARAASAAVGDR